MKIKKWLKEKTKYFIVFMLYIMYQTKFIYSFLNGFNMFNRLLTNKHLSIWVQN